MCASTAITVRLQQPSSFAGHCRGATSASSLEWLCSQKEAAHIWRRRTRVPLCRHLLMLRPLLLSQHRPWTAVILCSAPWRPLGSSRTCRPRQRPPRTWWAPKVAPVAGAACWWAAGLTLALCTCLQAGDYGGGGGAAAVGERAAAHCWPCCFHKLTMYQLHTARGPLPLATFPVSLASLGRWRGRRQAGQRRRRRQQRGGADGRRDGRLCRHHGRGDWRAG